MSEKILRTNLELIVIGGRQFVGEIESGELIKTWIPTDAEVQRLQGGIVFTAPKPVIQNENVR